MIEWNLVQRYPPRSPNLYPDQWYFFPLSELGEYYDDPDQKVMSLEEALIELDEINFKIKIPFKRALPINFSVVGIIHTPPSFDAPRAYLGASDPEKVILLIFDTPLNMNITKQVFDDNGSITFEMLDYYRGCPRTISSYRSWRDFPDVEKLEMILLLDRHPSMVTEFFVEACNTTEDLVYRVYGTYETAELISLMEHLLRIR